MLLKPSMEFDFSQLLPFTASCASGVTSAYLLYFLNRLPPFRRAKLLSRQLTHLAAADLLYSLVQVFSWGLNIGMAADWMHGGMPNALKPHFCDAEIFVSQVGGEASLIIECHLALTFVASIFKSTCALRLLSRCLPFVWVVAAVLAVASPAIVQPFWDEKRGTSCSRTNKDWISFVSILTVFVVCLVCYVMSTWHVIFTAGAAVRGSVGSRARTYLLAAVLACTPLALYEVTPESFLRRQDHARLQHVWFVIAYLAYDLNGLVHFSIYALQCRRARTISHTFRVGFRGRESVCASSVVSGSTTLRHFLSSGSNRTDVGSGTSSGASSEAQRQPAAGAQEDGAGNYFGEAWEDVSWFVDGDPLAGRSAGGRWTATDFAGSSAERSVQGSSLDRSNHSATVP